MSAALIQDVAARRTAVVAPAREGGRGGRGRGVDICGAALDESADHFAGVGGIAVLESRRRLIHSPLM